MSQGHDEFGFSGTCSCDLQTFLCYVASSWVTMLSYVMAGGPAVRMPSGNPPVACCDHLPGTATLRWWLVSGRFLLRSTRFGAEGFGVICDGFPTVPTLLDLLRTAF